MPNFPSHGVDLHFRDAGAGVPFVFQHGLGGDASQTFGLFQPPAGIRLITLECRGHGASCLGPVEQLSLATFAEDVVGLLDFLKLPSAIVGGISMGAAIGLRLGAAHPERCRGLVLSRPAWLDTANPFNVRVFGQITELLREHGASEGHRRFTSTAEFAEWKAQFPDTAQSLAGQFQKPRATEIAPLFARIAADTPGVGRAEWSSIRLPTLVLGNRRDPIHPFAFAEALAGAIPGARLEELTPKSVDALQHAAEVQRALAEFVAPWCRREAGTSAP